MHCNHKRERALMHDLDSGISMDVMKCALCGHTIPYKEEQNPVYIGAEDIMKLKAHLVLNEVISMFQMEDKSLEEQTKIKEAFIACLDSTQIT